MLNIDWDTFWSAYRGKRVALLGLARSNLPLIGILQQVGAQLLLCDRRADGWPELDQWRSLGFELHLGEGYADGYSADFLFRTPGIRPDIGGLPLLKANGAVLTSEMEAFFELCPCPIIGVTGSDGKSTTTALCAALLEAAGRRVYMGGNIGRPLLPLVREMRPDDFAVAELSSFQLMTMSRSPDIAVVTNVRPNHLDWHTSFDEYRDAKKHIFRHQHDTAVFNLDDPETAAMAQTASGHVVTFSLREPADVCLSDGFVMMRGEPIVSEKELKLPGRHNVANFCAALCAVGRWVDAETARRVARSFTGIEHRLEWVAEHEGVTYYNDSMATSPSRTAAGLRSFGSKVILLAGGYDKHIPFTELAETVSSHVKAMILTGPAAAQIRAAVEFVDDCPPLYNAAGMEDAVMKAAALARPGDIVLLSPACASFDAYQDFAERGRHFKSLVKELNT